MDMEFLPIAVELARAVEESRRVIETERATLAWKSARAEKLVSFEGSPLFGDAQQDLFGGDE